MTARVPAALALALAATLAACAPGGLERVEYVDADGRARMVELPRGATEAQVRAQLGGPNAIQRSVVASVTYWLYTYDHSRWNYVLEFHGGRLSAVHYQPRPGSTL